MNENEIQLYGRSKQEIIDYVESTDEYKSYGIRGAISMYLAALHEMNDHNVYGSYTASIRQTLNILNMLIYEISIKEKRV